MADDRELTVTDALKRNYIKPGSDAHKAMLESSYNMTVEDARTIMNDWAKDHQSWPFEQYQKAKAIFAAIEAKPVVVSKKPGWRRRRVE